MYLVLAQLIFFGCLEDSSSRAGIGRPRPVGGGQGCSEKQEFELSVGSGAWRKIEEATAESEKINGEIAGLASRTEQADSEISEKSKGVGSLKELGKARLPLDEIEDQNRPLVERPTKRPSSLLMRSYLPKSKKRTRFPAKRLSCSRGEGMRRRYNSTRGFQWT